MKKGPPSGNTTTGRSSIPRPFGAADACSQFIPAEAVPAAFFVGGVGPRPIGKRSAALGFSGAVETSHVTLF
jgi:hypothetical protein